MTNSLHQEILEKIKSGIDKDLKHSWGNNYLGSSHIYYNLPNPIKRKIVKDFVKKYKDMLILEDFVKLLDSLYKGKSYEEKTITGYLLFYLPKLRKQLDPDYLNSWLEELNGWAEIDSTCQSNFTASELLNKWGLWETFLLKLSKDNNINKRRASLVLLTGVVTKSSDPKLKDLAFHLIEKLKIEKDILITKAISWLLRDLTYLHRDSVIDYLNKNSDTLPKIAIREIKRKLATGRK